MSASAKRLLGVAMVAFGLITSWMGGMLLVRAGLVMARPVRVDGALAAGLFAMGRNRRPPPRVLDTAAELLTRLPWWRQPISIKPPPAGAVDGPTFGEIARAAERGEFRLRKPARSPFSRLPLVRMRICGYSLGALMPQDAVVFFDTRLRARAGDLVAFKYDRTWLEQTLAREMGDRRFAAIYGGDEIGDVGVKILTVVDSELALIGYEGSEPMPLSDGHHIIGVVRWIVDADGRALHC